MLPLEAIGAGTCGCGAGRPGTRGSPAASRQAKGCCGAHKARACCRAGNGNHAQCCQAGKASGCQCGAACQCGHSQDSAPAAPASDGQQTSKELSCQATVAAVLPAVIGPACRQSHDSEVGSPTVLTSLELCSELGRFLI
jgi:hypothetical protein